MIFDNLSNRPKLVLSAILFSVAMPSLAQEVKHTRLSKAQKKSLSTELVTMCANDQKYRWMLTFGELDEQKVLAFRKMDEKEQFARMKAVQQNKAGISQLQKDSLWQLQAQIDSLNFISVSEIISNYGYPKKWQDADNVSTILLHSPLRLIDDKFMKMLLQEVKNGKMPGIDYASIYDKIQIERKLPELYYVSEHFDSATKTFAIGKPADLAATNSARAEIGLEKIK
jgi:hypothetical protein